jgi:hypothetical protein
MFPAALDRALRVVLALRQAEAPDRADVLSRAYAVLQAGRLFVRADHTEALVHAPDADGTARVYHVSSLGCECPQGVHHPDAACKHGEALELWRRAHAYLAQAPEGAATRAVPIQGPLERSAEVGLLMAALARAQSRMQNPGFDRTNPHYHNRYPSLAEVRNTVLPPLTAEGIAVTQLPTTPQEGMVGVTTGLWHTSGQYLCSTLAMPVPAKVVKGERQLLDPQDYGSALSYCRRYALLAVCGVAGDEDDDAERLRQGAAVPGGTGAPTVAAVRAPAARTPECPEHPGGMSKSKHTGSWYCPKRTADGTFCTYIVPLEAA